MRAISRVRWLAAAGLLAGAAGLIAVRQTSAPERDRRALRTHVLEMQKLIRAHDGRAWLHVEADGHQKDAKHAAVHRAMLMDFERLAHLKDFEMREIDVEVSGDAARVLYRVHGTPEGRGQGVPSRGEVNFTRGPAGWEMTGHRFLESR